IASRSTQSGPLQRCQQWTCCEPSHRWDQESAANCSQHWSDKDTLEDLGFELGSRFLHSSFMSEQYADILRWKLCIQQILYCSRCGLFVPEQRVNEHVKYLSRGRCHWQEPCLSQIEPGQSHIAMRHIGFALGGFLWRVKRRSLNRRSPVV